MKWTYGGPTNALQRCNWISLTAESGSDRGRRQSRLHRVLPGKHEVRIYDYVDRQVPMLARMSERRQRGYRAMGYTEATVPTANGVKNTSRADARNPGFRIQGR